MLMVVYISESYFFYYRAQELCESGGGRPWFPVPEGPYGPSVKQH